MTVEELDTIRDAMEHLRQYLYSRPSAGAEDVTGVHVAMGLLIMLDVDPVIKAHPRSN